MARVDRRQFLGASLAATSFGFAIGGTKSSGRILGANDTIRIGVAGLNGRGGSHVDAFGKLPGVEVAALVDPDSRTFDKRIKQLRKIRPDAAPRTIRDIREALDSKDLDAISVATPNHWHALITVWACQAGKDVYVEKPCSHNVHEGRVAVEAARKYGRIVQHGTQGRSSASWAKLAELVKTGKFGKLLVSRGLCYKPRPPIGFKDVTAAPGEVDFALWTGPAATRPFHANLVHYNWHWFWDFGNGDVGNQGVHQMDVARWMIPGATLPRAVHSIGGRFGPKDQGETANTQVTLFDFGDAKLIFEVRGMDTKGYLGEKVGNTLEFESGIIAGGKFHPRQGDPQPIAELADLKRDPTENHFANFIQAVRSRNGADLKADILEGHYSSALCHLANISYRLSQPARLETETNPFAGTPAAEAYDRMADHLTQENNLPIAGLTYQVGPSLNFEPATETFVGAPGEASRMLTREYRKPFVVPDAIA